MVKLYAPSEEILAKNREALPTMEAVAKLTGEEFKKGEKPLADQVEEYFNSIGNSVYNEVLGDIELNRKGVDDSIRKGLGRLKVITFKGVPEVLRNGSVIEYANNHKGRNYDTAIIAAPVDIAGERKYVAAVVRRNAKREQNNEFQRFYLHEVFTENKPSELFSKDVTDFL